jgi:hypothetical protein
VTDLYGGFWLQVCETTRTLKNRYKIDRGEDNMILALELTNNDPMKMMES